ncbi:hypothetical protein B9G98_04366 [Wickerhamiella sorbophila]|uniref:Uncharacterized protein n=1 Tax=Wickerhamiella sorbophila TaxID=45607 RepID=A0A2T0FP30_9ASCO|nr:hypothetical protein B9G98_04366 [Wickerhamiella sorbophila]PRT56746.1 hypothetical protein B9G98_04366 [Wickerhamiella sorbophila]
MDASHLRRSARVLLGSPLSRVYLSQASNQEGQKDTLVCNDCCQLQIPGMTCSVRTIGLLGNKASRKRQLARIHRYLANVSNKTGKFTGEVGKKYLITCWSCGNISKTPYRRSQRSNTKAVMPSTIGRNKKNNAKTKSTASEHKLPKQGLSLSDFLL